jgi:hypothetical protein
MKKNKLKQEDTKCAPHAKYDHKSCFSLESLIKMSLAYNDKIKKKKMEGKLIDIKQDKKHLVLELTNRLKDICDDQICWLKQDFVKHLNDIDINDKTFRPIGPQGQFTWLNTTNINEVMKQYEHTYPEFKFYGALPIDFDSINEYGIRKLDFNNLIKNNINKLGFVFNFDEHWQSGSHWVAMFVNLLDTQIYYFDSYGKRPKKRIRNLVNRIAKWCYNKHILYKDNYELSMTEESFMHPTNKNYIEKKLHKIKFNQNRHQYKNSECGVYSVNFILRLLKGENFEYICDNITKDDDINKCRDVYFRFE